MTNTEAWANRSIRHERETEADELLTVACEYFFEATRSDAQGMVEAMPLSRKTFILNQLEPIILRNTDK